MSQEATLKFSCARMRTIRTALPSISSRQKVTITQTFAYICDSIVGRLPSFCEMVLVKDRG
jgi:hypothetical protein